MNKLNGLFIKTLFVSIVLASSFFTHELNSMQGRGTTPSPSSSTVSSRTPSPRFFMGASRASSPQEVMHKFFVIKEGEFYRSRKLSSSELKSYMQHYGIKTVINLCGKEVGWWLEQKETVEQKGAVLIDIPFIDGKFQSKENILKLLDVFDKAEKPILVHCSGGIDRAGLATALWMLYKQGETLEEALKAFLSVDQNSAEVFFIKIWQGRERLEQVYDPEVSSLMFDLVKNLEKLNLDS